MAKSKPKIILSAAMTLDGKIATKIGDSELSSKKDKIRLHRLRSKVDAILVGIRTVNQDDPMLNVRYVKGKNPIRIILDSRAQIDSKSRIIKTCNKIPTIVAVSKKASSKNIARLEKNGVDVISSGKNQINIKKFLKILSRKKIRKILLEGGGTINWEFVKHGLVDEAIITIAPYLLGGKNAVSLVEGDGFTLISKALTLKLQKTSRQGNEVVLHYAH